MTRADSIVTPRHEYGEVPFLGALGPVVCDLRAIQSPDHRGRGIGRWSYEFATALERTRPDLVGAYLLDPTWPPPGAVDELLATGKLAYLGSAHADRAIERSRLYHCLSPFELGRSIAAMRPSFVDQRGISYSAVVYDLIPLRHPDRYLEHPAQRRRYLARLEVLRNADALLAISAHAANDVGELLGVDASRCQVVGTGVSRHFVPPASRAGVLETLLKSVEGLTGPFVLFPGGTDGRKNIDGLIAAFSELPVPLRRRFQLVIVGDLPPPTVNHYRHLAGLAGIGDRLVLTGFVSDQLLTELYQATELFVFPSFAEGYGLPIAEALACGAVAAVSDQAPFDELVPTRKARFDPSNTLSMAAVVERCLTDRALRSAVLKSASSTVSSWDEVALRAAPLFDDLCRRKPRPWTRTRRIAFVSPLPPISSGVADYSAKLLYALDRVIDRRQSSGEPAIEIDCFADGLDRYPAEPEPVGDVKPRDARVFEITDAATGSYDRVVYVLGNSECHASALAALRRRPGTLFCHDVRLSGLMTFSSETPGAVPGGLQATIQRAYGQQLPAHLGEDGSVAASDRDRYGLLLLRDLLGHTDQLLVSSEAARRLAELDSGPVLADRIGVLPFAMARLSADERRAVEVARALRRAREGSSGRALVAAFGIVDPSKRPKALVAAVAELSSRGVDVELALVGPVSEALSEELRTYAAGLGVSDRTRVLGPVPWDEYLQLLGEAEVAVQLRERFFGEASGAVSECLSAGVPTIVSDLGWMGELPDDVVAKVPHECATDVIASSIERLLADDGERSALAVRGEDFASTRTFEAAAEALLAKLDL
jgi:glycosyltransferase involved in cell wall biosynthesis